MVTPFAKAHKEYTRCRRAENRLEERAGNAKYDYDRVKDDLETLCGAFAEQWRDGSLENLRRSAGRIRREADKLMAAMELPDARDATRAAAAERNDQRAMQKEEHGQPN